MRTSTLSVASFLASIACACASAAPSSSPSPPPPTAPSPSLPAPTYTELFTKYFAPGTPGHCATAGCHADPGHNAWLCGTTKESCYAGMVDEGLIDLAHPEASMIADPSRSPLTWVNPAGGDMPLDAQGANAAAMDAITAWAAAGARND